MEVCTMTENVMVVEYVCTLNNKEFVQYAMYNKLVITEKEVKKLINSGMVDYDDRVIVLNQKQFEFLRKS